MTSLGLLGEYGSVSSGSEISDSEEEFEPVRTRSVTDQSINKTSGNSQRNKTQSLNFVDKEERKSGKFTDGDPLNFVQGGDDDSSSSNDDSDSEEDLPLEEKDTSIPLPLPDLDLLTSQIGKTSSSSVFSNPFKVAEDAKLAILKRHVSEFAPDEKPPSPRSRHKHRKGGGGSRGNKNRSIGGGTNSVGGAVPTYATPTGDHDPHRLFNDDDSSVSESVRQGKRKNRSGVSSNLVPPKKFQKSYEKIQAEERPWTVNKT